jgi:hypothetical protein
MPTGVAPVWQHSDNILSLVHQADESPRLPDAVAGIDTSSSSVSLSPVLTPSKSVARIPCPPGFEAIEASVESLPSAPVVVEATVAAPVVEEVAAPVVQPVVHDDFEIETSRIECVVPTMMNVTPVTQQVDTITSDPVSAPIMAAAAFAGRNAAIRTLIMALVALAALGAVIFTSSSSSASSASSSFGMGAALPSVMLFAAFINRSHGSQSSPSLFDDDFNTSSNTNSKDSNSDAIIKSSPKNNKSASSPSSRSSSQKGRRSSRRRSNGVTAH